MRSEILARGAGGSLHGSKVFLQDIDIDGEAGGIQFVFVFHIDLYAGCWLFVVCCCKKGFSSCEFISL
jgi:hypothetical protein